jgi:hypothetical protein
MCHQTSIPYRLSSESGYKNTERRAYRIVNWVILGLMLYMLALPWLSPLFKKCLPSICGVCPYRELSGKPCPLCGMTRAVGAILHGDFQSGVSLNPLSIFAVLFMLFEAIFRALLLHWHISPQRRSSLVRADISAHVLIGAAFICYLVTFFL